MLASNPEKFLGLRMVQGDFYCILVSLVKKPPASQLASRKFFYLGEITSAPPMYGRRTSGIVTEPSSFW